MFLLLCMTILTFKFHCVMACRIRLCLVSNSVPWNCTQSMRLCPHITFNSLNISRLNKTIKFCQSFVYEGSFFKQSILVFSFVNFESITNVTGPRTTYTYDYVIVFSWRNSFVERRKMAANCVHGVLNTRYLGMSIQTTITIFQLVAKIEREIIF